MAEKKAVTAKKSTTKKESMKGQSYECGVCGMEITVDEDCGCEETCDIFAAKSL